MKTYRNYVVKLVDRSPLLVRASSPETAATEAIRYENASFANLYRGLLGLTADDVLSVAESRSPRPDSSPLP